MFWVRVGLNADPDPSVFLPADWDMDPDSGSMPCCHRESKILKEPLYDAFMVFLFQSYLAMLTPGSGLRCIRVQTDSVPGY